MNSFRFSVVVEQNSGGFCAFCPELDDCYVEDETYDGAIEKIREQIMNCLEDKLENGEDIPQSESFCSTTFAIQYSLN